MVEPEKPRSLFFQPDISIVESITSDEKKTRGINPQLLAITFASLTMEGDLLTKNGEHGRAVQSYTKALDMRTGDRATLVARSRCYMLMGKNELALKDADRALEGDRTYVKGILQKAEAHFSAGDFEQALMFYHRGGKIRPDMEEFRLGIQKSKEAIDDALFGPIKDPGSPTTKLALSFNRNSRSSVNMDSFRGPQSTKSSIRTPHAPTASQKSLPSKSTNTRPKTLQSSIDFRSSRMTYPVPVPTSSSSSRKLLGKLYDDKKYLEDFLRDTTSKKSDGIQNLAETGLKYLDKREDFWRQQNAVDNERQLSPPQRPTSAYVVNYLVRTDERASTKLIMRNASQGTFQSGLTSMSQASVSAPSLPALRPSSSGPASRPKSGQASLQMESNATAEGETQHIPRRPHSHKASKSANPKHNQDRVRYIEESQIAVHTIQFMSKAFVSGDPNSAVRAARDFLSQIPTLDIPDKPRIVGSIFYHLGKGFIEQENYALSVVYLQKDLEIAVEYNFKDAILRSLGQLALAQQCLGNPSRAISIFKKKLELAPEAEIPHIYLSIGICHNDLGEFLDGSQYAKMCLDWFDTRSNQGLLSDAVVLQLKMHANGLAGRCLKGLGNYKEAVLKLEAYAQIAQRLEIPSEIIEALNLLSECHGKLGNSSKLAELNQQLSATQQTNPKIPRPKDKKQK